MIVVITALTLAYALSGWIAILLAIPPGYAAPIFPPAGIALTALLVFGRKAWIGVALGSLAIQIITGINTDIRGWAWAGFVFVPMGATLQALVGAALAKRLGCDPSSLESPASILRFFALVAPLTCLISPSIAIPSLYATGAIAAGEISHNWLSWWLGETLGVIVFTPILLTFLASPAQTWRPRRLTVAMPLLLALLALILTYVQVSRWEDARIKAQFQRDADKLSELISRRLKVQLDMMLSIERLMSVSAHINRDEWRDFVLPWVERYPGAANFAWSPLVLHADREKFEALAQSEGAPNFRILNRDKDNNLIPAIAAEISSIQQVFLYGSILQTGCFHAHSDVDVAVGVTVTFGTNVG